MVSFLSYFHTFSTETNGKTVKNLTLLSIHFGRLRFYNKDWSKEDVFIYEAMLVLSRKYRGKPFFMQQKRLEAYTRVSAHHIRKALKKLSDLEIISYERKGNKRMYYYTVHYDQIKEKLTDIYDFSMIDNDVEKQDCWEIMKRNITYMQHNQFHSKIAGEPWKKPNASPIIDHEPTWDIDDEQTQEIDEPYKMTKYDIQAQVQSRN